MSRPARGRTLGEVLRRRAELSALAASQRADLARRAGELGGLLRWVDRGIALASALRRGASLLTTLAAARRLFSRHPS